MKLKNRGFAITALLYGLSIMALMTVVLLMSIMQNSRKNNTTVVKDVEQELNSYGEATADFVGGGTKYIVPSGQTGYYKIEVFNGGSSGTLSSGTVYLKENDVLNLSVANNTTGTTSVSIGGNTIIDSSGTINGSARTTSTAGEYHFLNGQYFTGINNSKNGKGVVKISKVSTTEPGVVNHVLEKVGCVKVTSPSAAFSKITLAGTTYNKENGSINRQSGTGQITFSNNTPLSEIYIKINSEVTNPVIDIYNNTNCTSGHVYTIKGSPGYTFQAGTEVTINRYQPIDNNGIQVGNFAFSRLTSDTNKKHKTVHKNTLSTSAYTPTSEPPRTGTLNPNLIIWGTTSIGRPVIINTYQSLNSQKWRVESSTAFNGTPRYRILEIEEYKPFAFNTDAQDTATGPTGPALICGVYQWKEGKFTAHDNEMNSLTENKLWEFVPAGLGLFALKANHNTTNSRYIACNDKNNSETRCYVTNKAEEATLFEVFNVNY